MNGSTWHLNYTSELYNQREPRGSAFGMNHCWVLLQHNEKCEDRNNNSYPPKKKSKPSSVTTRIKNDDSYGDE